MSRRLQLQSLIAVLSVGLMFSSCGNIDIVKRKYRPGFHVDISKKRQKNKVAETASVKENRRAEKANQIVAKTAKVAVQDVPELTANNAEAIQVQKFTNNKQKRANLKKEFKSPDFKGLSFERKMQRIQREVFKPTNAAGSDWMKWVTFGTGIGSLAFGAMAFILSFLTGVFASTIAWPFIVLGLLLGAAAIVFYILYKNQNGTDPKARLGFIFGIIGAGLSVLAIIIWAIFWAVFVL